VEERVPGFGGLGVGVGMVLEVACRCDYIYRSESECSGLCRVATT
jgi:hypothetical protein